MTSQVLVIENDPVAPIDLAMQWLVDAGLKVDLIKPHAGDHMPSEIPAKYSGLLVLGGEMGAHDDEEFAWLTPQRSLMKDVIAQDFPFVGICLGAQMLATALDGKSIRTPSPEAGVSLIEISKDAVGDQLFGELAGKTVPAVTWHQDYIVNLPEDAVVFGSTKDCPVHAYRIGKNVYGMQFHPEVSAQTVESWATPDSYILHKIDKAPEVALSEVQESSAELIRIWKPIFTRFAEMVKASPGD